MRKSILFAIVVMIGVIAVSSCSSVAPDAGFEGVLVKHPKFVGTGGVDETPVKTGLTYVAWSTSAVMVDMRPKQQEIVFDDLFTLDGVPLDFHSAIQYRITDSVKLVKNFGADDGPTGMGFFHRNLEMKFRQLVRDAVKKHGLNEMAINVTAAKSVDDEVIAKTDVPIQLISITLGRANPPDAIKHQRIATAEQEQRQKTEQQAKLAEDQRKAHEESRAAADNTYRESMHLSLDQYVQLMRIDMLRQTCAGGKCTFIEGNAVPTLPLR